MLPGLNTDMAHGDVGYHIQTEDLGARHPVILTLVYARGAVVLRQQLDYGERLGEQPPAASIKALMEAQHQEILGRVANGDVPSSPASHPEAPGLPRTGPREPAAPAAPKSLDALIEEYLRARQRARAR